MTDIVKQLPMLLFLFLKKCSINQQNMYPIHQIFEPRHGISNNVVFATNKGPDQPAHTRSLIRAFASRLNIL